MGEICHDLHQLFNNLERFSFPFNEDKIPKNGIYILFEKGEFTHDRDRVVRIGTHTGIDKLRSRLIEHFIIENKNRSIFRKNIGRAMLNQNNDPYLKTWEYDTTSRKNKERYLALIDQGYQKEIEQAVTKIICDNFSFVVIEEEDKAIRLSIEEKLISEISNCTECKSSADWLGNHSPKDKIRESGIWQVNKLYKQGFTKDEFLEFSNLLTT